MEISFRQPWLMIKKIYRQTVRTSIVAPDRGVERLWAKALAAAKSGYLSR